MLTGKKLGNAIASALLLKKRGAQAQLAEALGMKPPSVSELKETGRLDKSKLPVLWKFFSDVVGPEHWGLERYPWAEPNIELGPTIKGRVPLISWVQAGHWGEVIDNFAPGDAEDWLLYPKGLGPKAYALRVRGISMVNPNGRPSYEEGDVIFVDPDRLPNHRDRVIVRLDDENEATFKQLFIEGEKMYLKALNPAWPPENPGEIIPVNGNATICGVVVGKWVVD